MFTNTISGFKPNTNDPDPNFATCLQCAAIDRGRLKVSPPIPRSDACTKCFQQYCYDPQNPPSKDVLTGRKLDFVDPDPEGFSKLGGFFSRNKFALIGGLVGLVALLGLMIGGLYVDFPSVDGCSRVDFGPAGCTGRKERRTSSSLISGCQTSMTMTPRGNGIQSMRGSNHMNCQTIRARLHVEYTRHIF